MYGRSHSPVIRTTIDRTHLTNIATMVDEYVTLQNALQILMARVLEGGIGFFNDEAEVHVDLDCQPELDLWVNGVVKTFVEDAVRYLAVFGFFLYGIDPEKATVTIEDPRNVTITAYRMHPTSEVRYILRHDLDRVDWCDDLKSTKNLYIYAAPSAFDLIAGHTTAVGAKLLPDYITTVTLMHNFRIRDTHNTVPAFSLAWDSNTLDPFTRRSADEAGHRGSAGIYDTIGEYSTSYGDQAVALAERREAVYFEGARYARDMVDRETPPDMGTMMTNVQMPMRTSAQMVIVRPNPPGCRPVQQASLDESASLPTLLLHMGRMVYTALGVPYSMVEKQTGNHANASDLERELLERSARAVRGPINAVLNLVSVALLASKGCPLLAMLDRPRPTHMRIRNSMSLQQVLRLYELNILEYQQTRRTLGVLFRCPKEAFEPEDPRRRDEQLALKLEKMRKPPAPAPSNTSSADAAEAESEPRKRPASHDARRRQNRTTNPMATTKRSRHGTGPSD